MNLKGIIGDVVSNAVKQHFSGGSGDQNRNQSSGNNPPHGQGSNSGASGGYDPYSSNRQPQNPDMYNQGYGGGYPGGGSSGPGYPQSGGPGYPGGQSSAYAPYPLDNQMPGSGYPGQHSGSGYPGQGGPGYPQGGPGYPSHGGPGYPSGPGGPGFEQGYGAQSGHGYQPQGGGYPAQQPQGYGPGSSPYPPQGPPHHGHGGSYGGGVYPTMAMDRVAQEFHGMKVSGPQMATNPSLRPSPTFNANADAEALRKAMKGFGTNNTKVIQVICGRTNWERQEINRAFKTMYGKDLIKDLKSELSGDFEDLILALMEPPAMYDAKQLHKAMAGLGTKESVLIEIMCSRTNAQIFEVKNAYRQLYGKDLERELIGETSGHFKRLLTSLCAGGRDESMRTDPLKANQDARALYRAGEQRLGTDESTFNAILASQNYAQLRLVFDEYQKVTKHSIEQAIQGEFSGDIRDGLLAIVKCIKNRAAYFAELLNASMRGLGTRDNDLIRLVTSRSEIDLRDVRNEYQRIYKTSLEQAIAGDCSGNYKEALIALVKGNY